MKQLARKLLCIAVLVSFTGLTGCASTVVNGTLIGAGAGAVAGAGVGLVISDENLAGSSADGPGSDTSLPKGETILASLAVGTMLGAIIGAMAGHQSEQKYVRRKPVPPPPDAASASVDPIIGKL